MKAFRWRGSIAFWSVVIAAALVTCRTFAVGSGVVLQVPVPTQPAHLTQSFTVRLAGLYEGGVLIPRPTDEASMFRGNCLLGITFESIGPRCEVAPVLDLSWRFYQQSKTGEQQIGSGELTGLAGASSASADEITRLFDSPIQAVPGTVYRLEVQTRSTTAALQPYHPRFVVRTTGATNEDEMVKTLFVWLVAAVILISGIAAALVSLARDSGSPPLSLR